MTISHDLPVSIIAGYLGSGKTTHLNQRLAQANGVRYGVLVNDFGELNIDEALIESSDVGSVSLTNGCVCCSIAHDVEGAIETLSAMADQLDWVLFEASGVADPVRTKSIVENWPGFRIADTAILIDATRIQQLVKDKFVGGHVQAQLHADENLVVSKSDLLEPKRLGDLYEWLEQIRKVPFTAVKETPQFYSEVVSYQKVMKQEQLTNWLEKLPETIVRVKGFVELNSGPHLLQWVDGQYALSSVVARPKQERGSHLVIIGVTAFQLEPLV